MPKESPDGRLGNREIPKRTPGQTLLLPPHHNIRLHSTKSLRIVGECWVSEKCFGFHLVWNLSTWNNQKCCLLYDRVRFPSTDLQPEREFFTFAHLFFCSLQFSVPWECLRQLTIYELTLNFVHGGMRYFWCWHVGLPWAQGALLANCLISSAASLWYPHWLGLVLPLLYKPVLWHGLARDGRPPLRPSQEWWCNGSRQVLVLQFAPNWFDTDCPSFFFSFSRCVKLIIFSRVVPSSYKSSWKTFCRLLQHLQKSHLISGLVLSAAMFHLWLFEATHIAIYAPVFW